MGTVNGVLNLFCAAFTLVLLLSLLPQTQTRQTKDARIFRRMLLAALVMLLFDGIGWLCFARQSVGFRLFATVALLGFYAVLSEHSRYLISALKAKNTFSLRLNQLHNLFCAASALLWLLNACFPFFYNFSSSRFLHPFWEVLIFLLAGIIMVDNALLVILNREKLGTSQFIIMLLVPMLPPFALLLRIFSAELNLLYAMIFFVLLCNYVRLVNIQLSDFVAQQAKLHDLQIRSTTERMKPHYIYNVLTSIYYLCESNPAVAQQAVGAFSDYLRSVLDNLNTGELIPFQQELQTIQSYLDLEHMRFGDRFHVHYNIETDQFLLPPFSVQPLVENAVKHGVGKTDIVGEIYIESFETPTHFLVVVRDNCGGFEVEQFQHNKSNFGLRYIQRILEMTVGGKLKIESEVGTGTAVTVQIPKKNEDFFQKN